VKKRHLLAAALATFTSFPVPAVAADVGVSVSIGQPGFYGRIDIGSFPQPQLIYGDPMIAIPGRAASGRPLYLHVPPGHAKNWAKHCHRYGACYQPVYFVQERWYQDVYVPRYRQLHPGERRELHRGEEGRRYEERRRYDEGRPGARHFEDRPRAERRADRDDARDRRGPPGRPDRDEARGNGGGKGKGRDD
jgi:hypothetical protein